MEDYGPLLYERVQGCLAAPCTVSTARRERLPTVGRRHLGRHSIEGHHRRGWPRGPNAGAFGNSPRPRPPDGLGRAAAETRDCAMDPRGPRAPPGTPLIHRRGVPDRGWARSRADPPPLAPEDLLPDDHSPPRVGHQQMIPHEALPEKNRHPRV